MSFRIGMLRTVSRYVSFSVIASRSFSKCPLLRCRLLGAKFIPKENTFAHGVFAKNPEKFIVAESARFDESKSDPCLSTDWMNIPIQEFCDSFYSVSSEAHQKNINMSESRYSEMCSAVKLRKDEFNVDQLALIIKSLVLWPFVKSVRETNFYNVWKTLDDRCLDHWKEWDIEKLLYFVDLWYLSRLARQSDFCFVVVTKLATRPGRLSGHQAVQVLFYLNILRTALVGVSLYDIELKLYESINDLSIEEIGVALMGFFKTQHLLHDQRLISELINRVQKESKTIHEITLASILKVVRNSLPPALFDTVTPTLDLLEKEIERLSLQSCVHISLLVTKSITFHRPALTKVSQKLVDNISDARLKDIEKVIYPITLVSLDPLTIPCVYQTVVDELQKPEREEEIREYPKTLAALLYYLSLRNIFIEPLISKVLDEKFITQTYGKNKFGISREILYLDTSVELQCPNYNGPRLSSSVRDYLSKRYSQFVPTESFKKSRHSEYFLDVVNILETLVDKNYTFKYLLPNHPRADIVVRLSKDNEVLPIPEDYKNLRDFGGIIRAPKDDKWCAIVVASRNMFAHSAAIPTGETTSKLRQLKLIGYTPIMVQSTEWPRLDTLHKISYLKNLIFC